MKPHSSRNRETWPRHVTLGRVSVAVYRRRTPAGRWAFMVANYANGKRRFDSYATETEALEAAGRLARQLSQRDVLAASMTNEQASDYAAAVQALEPFAVPLPAAASTLAECLKLVGNLPTLHAAAQFYVSHHRRIERKPVTEVVQELMAVKEKRGASSRYLQDLRFRLTRFAEAFRKNTGDVTTAEVQAWLDSQRLAPQSYANFRRVVHLLFEFAVARNYAADNPVGGVENVRVNGGDVEIFTPVEIARLLAAAAPEFRPCLAIGAFAGLRSAEIERLEWDDIDLAGGHIVVGASKAKTASRRVVPIADNLTAWLVPYTGREGRVWTGSHEDYYQAQQETAAATAVEPDPANGVRGQRPVAWKANALRHSYASYRFAQTGDAGRVAGELGNSAAMVRKHYRELVKPADAARWFAVRPEAPVNVTALPAAADA